MGKIIWEILYGLVLFGMCLYGVHRYFIIYLFLKHRRRIPAAPARFEELPRVTVQLPVFNEMYVVDRLIGSVAALDYPKDRLQIQVLDDSTDETRELTRARVEALRAEGFDAEWVHRVDRTGFKAGALERGLESASGEFILILDADFVPPPDLLRKAIDHFTDPKVGMVQARWGHINRNYSLLTRVQALFIDAHFVLEQTARSRSGRFFNFNGTSGIWRRACIEDAGGWEHDTLTEDLDLSYRAQLRGWRFVYRPDIETPAELPVEMNGFKSQQHRWAKGSVQTCMKLLPALWKSGLPFRVKIEGLAHFTSYFISLLLVCFCLLIQPSLAPVSERSMGWMLAVDLPIFILTSIPFVVYYVFAQRELNPGRWVRELTMVPFMIAMGAGVSINNSRAVLEALFGVESAFVRTPKYGIDRPGQTWRRGRYSPLKSMLIVVEIAFAAYFVFLVLRSAFSGTFELVPFLAIFAAGFIYVAWQSVASLLPRPQRVGAQPGTVAA
jgi:cellulose synthase/poly-beta-1,6-N-acetylglucosamine synthase-like glycosyltransferase